jgi:hypothetical protein
MEAQIRETLSRFREGNRGHEDLFIELKRELPTDPSRAARRIAALCNSAHGAEALWIVGVDEKTGTSQHDMQQNVDVGRWWPQVTRCFDDIAPDMRHVIVHVEEGQPVIGLFFATDQAPYVIKLSGGVTQKEIPWREATNTRSATRREIMQMLAPVVNIPRIDHIQTYISAQRWPGNREEGERNSLTLSLSTQLFVDATSQVAFPIHKQKISIRLDEVTLNLDARLHFSMSQRRNDDFLKISNDVIVASLPSMMWIEGQYVFKEPLVALEDLISRCSETSFNVELGLSGFDKACVIRGVARRATGSEMSLDRPPSTEPWRPEAWHSGESVTVA